MDLAQADQASVVELLRQHTVMVEQLEAIRIGLLAALFFVLVLMLAVFGLAAWSVRAVNRRQGDLEGKFGLLIEILLKQAERQQRIDAAAAAERLEDRPGEAA